MEQKKIMVIGAHPDDPDIKFGGTGLKLARAGHEVKFVSVTNGDHGHHRMRPEALAERRAGECARAGKFAGISYEVLGVTDTEVTTDLETRRLVVRAIRKFQPDIVLTHRPEDYHPDHRATGILVQDASYLLQVPLFCEDTPAMKKMPVIMFLQDDFKHPYQFQADVAVNIDDVFDDKMKMLGCHESQVYEWLPFVDGVVTPIPEGEAERHAWLKKQWEGEYIRMADRFRDVLLAAYGEEKSSKIQYAETCMLCEYGSILPVEELREIFCC